MEFISNSLILAEYVRKSTPNAKADIYGVFSALQVPLFPCNVMGFYWLWKGATRHSGKTERETVECELVIEKPDGNTVELARVEFTAEGSDEVSLFEFQSAVPPLTFQDAGLRLIQIRSKGVVLASAPLLVQLAVGGA